MKELTLENFLKESAFLAPEQFTDVDFMNQWCDKYFAVRYDTPLGPIPVGRKSYRQAYMAGVRQFFPGLSDREIDPQFNEWYEREVANPSEGWDDHRAS